MLIIKKSLPVQAFQLGRSCCLEQQLIRSGHLLPLQDGLWRIKTREALTVGELVKTGDYIKIDRSGMPYPTEKDWFEANHTQLEENLYLQIAEPKIAWKGTHPIIPEIQFLLDRNLLIWTPGDPDQTFRAQLWGTLQTAAADAVVVLDRVETDHLEKIQAVEFHFVANDEFQTTYDILQDPH